MTKPLTKKQMARLVRLYVGRMLIEHDGGGLNDSMMTHEDQETFIRLINEMGRKIQKEFIICPTDLNYIIKIVRNE